MSAEPAPSAADAPRARDIVGGFLAAFSIFAAAIGVAWHPLRLVPLAALLALISAGLRERDQRLPFAALLIAAFCFVAGMSVAVVTKNPLW